MIPEQGQVRIHGQLYLSLDVVAHCYEVQVDWLTRVYELGLLGSGERIQTAIAIPVVRLDRVARIIRWHFHYGQDLASLEPLLGDEEGDSAYEETPGE